MFTSAFVYNALIFLAILSVGAIFAYFIAKMLDKSEEKRVKLRHKLIRQRARKRLPK
ncbi:hypothetical protein KVP40.0093 [Vibrio phage KVP40]|uniref:Uncharacterized protein n=1 Tax=Vibrio phage KVP40 (isolate Vibrio parahaemolyticus/Japan/Matsuzaki/1991) TaxID=75320 RepID=Q6WI59_BPKVM|nr:hypothetical protein KVP40.0093 [Vibrio phage KVP40]AAQ64164.1 hypothetical protein KVP40.0093 [Vibrio phage KVP40]UNA01994.1 hypothetical protein [Vibrio phage PC-Liy1]URQ03292.1 hypothetical protein PVA8_306 [Vibrio phage PVA8]WBM59026.1 hypothetical protein vBValMPVA8_304 [Vibrio phage vB_ValM_PVA8]